MDGQIRIGILDPYAIVRDGLKILLETREELMFVGEADTCEAGFDLCQTQLPDVLLCDFLDGDQGRMPLISTLHTLFPQLCIVVLTTVEEVGSILAAIGAGASGYLLKQGSIDSLAAAIGWAWAGVPVLDERVSGTLAQQIHPAAGPWKLVSL